MNLETVCDLSPFIANAGQVTSTFSSVLMQNTIECPVCGSKNWLQPEKIKQKCKACDSELEQVYKYNFPDASAYNDKTLPASDNFT